MNKVWKGITFLPMIFKELTIIVIAMILAKNPCKKCIVQACCSERCEERTVFENFILRGETLKHQKLFAWAIAIYVPSVICTLLYHTFNLLTKH